MIIVISEGHALRRLGGEADPRPPGGGRQDRAAGADDH